MGYLYSVYDVADALGTHPETVRRWIRNGDLKTLGGLVLGRRYGYIMSTDQVTNFICSNPMLFRRYSRQWYETASKEECNDFDSTTPLFADKVVPKEEPLWTTTISDSQTDRSQ